MLPDWTTFNGYASQYVTHPLTADPGETVRFYVVAARPTLDTNFHSWRSSCLGQRRHAKLAVVWYLPAAAPSST